MHTKAKAQAVADLCASATKLMVGGTSVYVENETKVNYRKDETKVNYRKDVASASKQLKRKVVALSINYVDTANDVRTSEMRVLVGYTEDQLCVAFINPDKQSSF